MVIQGIYSSSVRYPIQRITPKPKSYHQRKNSIHGDGLIPVTNEKNDD